MNEKRIGCVLYRILKKCHRPAAPDFFLKPQPVDVTRVIPMQRVIHAFSVKSLDNYLFFHYAILLSLHGVCRKSVSPRGERPSLICVHVTKISLKEMITARTPERLWIIITIIWAISSMEKVPAIFLPAKSEKPIDKQAKTIIWNRSDSTRRSNSKEKRKLR